MVPHGCFYELLERRSGRRGHWGVGRTIAAVTRHHFWWPAIKADAVKFVTSCVDCQFGKAPKYPSPTGRSAPTQSPFAFHTLHLDPFGALPTGEYIIVIVDTFTRFLWLVLSREIKATDVIRVIKDLARQRGEYPRTLRVDGAKQLSGKEMTAFATAHKFTVSPSPVHAHHTLGMAESKNHVFATLAKTIWGA